MLQIKTTALISPEITNTSNTCLYFFGFETGTFPSDIGLLSIGAGFLIPINSSKKLILL